MARRRLRLAPAVDGAELRRRFAAIRADLGVPQGFSPGVLREAEASVWHGEEPDADLRDIAFVTIDPPGSMDLDQAVYIARDGDGYRLDYAIADIPGFVDPAGPLAQETLRRGQTFYSPDCRTPLHPEILSEDGASLLPGRDRPAIVWRFLLDAAGEVERVDVARALVRSRERLDYAGVMRRAEKARSRGAGAVLDAPDMIAVLLEEVGVRRLALERARGGASLPLPDQEVEPDGDGFVLRLHPKLASEEWNAQISLMTGMAAASIMLDGGIGILRTLPPASPQAVDRLRAQASALGTPWPQEEPYGTLLSRLDPSRPAELALLHGAATLLRGARYTAFEGAAPGADALHAAVAAPYAHVTAPLRRLVDRFTLACCRRWRMSGRCRSGSGRG